ncbi:MAG: hypothetical protein FWD82_04450 [Defluviitaleaceae bacterium]|nr:hypothetical protein [Defluviitaleaceae bacterium]
MMIVSCIELVLVQERTYSLTPTDAWLILMCSYKHDMGMLVNPTQRTLGAIVSNVLVKIEIITAFIN